MNRLLKNWNPVRLLRLVIGVGSAVFAIVSGEHLLLILSAMFLFQAAFNVSCCGAGGCASAAGSDNTEVYKGQIKEYKQEE